MDQTYDRLRRPESFCDALEKLPEATVRGRYMHAVACIEHVGVPFDMEKWAKMLWIRGLIKPPPGYGLCNLDYVQQEFGIAGALSGDSAMIAAYQSGDSYLWFAKQSGAVPPDATKKSHEHTRDQFKACVLETQFGVGEEALASQINQPISMARHLLRLHRKTFGRYWEWLDEVLNHSFLNAILSTVYGWKQRITENNCNARAVGNFFCQANGAEMLRLACIFGTEAGIQICAPIHDAVMIIAPLHRLDADIVAMQGLMEKASEYVLDGFQTTNGTADYSLPRPLHEG